MLDQKAFNKEIVENFKTVKDLIGKLFNNTDILEARIKKLEKENKLIKDYLKI